MENLKEIIIGEGELLRNVLKSIDESSKKICLISDASNKLLGTISDGDIRRALLNGASLSDTVENIYHRNPTTIGVYETKEDILNIFKLKKISQLPVVDKDNKIIGLKTIEELIDIPAKPNRVVLMVGGLGTRLRPLTESTPKPMLLVGGKPILQTIVENLVSYGFVNISMCTGYKSELIQDFFKDGVEFGANIEYILEEKRMGTAGALSLLKGKQKPDDPFIVMNGDILTNVNFENMMSYHINNEAKSTMCVREYDFQVPYGVVILENELIKNIDEKPLHKFFVSAGIYILDPSCIEMIPKNEYYDIPSLFEEMIKSNVKVVSFPLHEYWLDIGQMEEYNKANREYHQIF
jgi:dTDP-glucose pyrophosphorylase